MRSIPSFSLFVATMFGISCLAHAEWLGSAFTYQGQISQQGELINGEIDLRFSIWTEAGIGNPPAGGEQVGESHLIVGVPLSRGQFSVLLNDQEQFGDEAFNGAARWLQIEVCDDASCASPLALSPRQMLTAAPFAHSPWKFNAGNVVFTGEGRVGIGTAAPSHQLRVAGGPIWTSNWWIGSIELDNAAAIGWRSNSGDSRFGIGQSTGGLYVFRTTSDPGTSQSAARYDLFVSDAGRVGIGTTSPAARLHAKSTGVQTGVMGESTSIGVYGLADGSSATRQGIRGENGSVAAGGYAGLFFGTTHVNGTLTKSAGSFRIDHPLDPENRFLSHSFVESPDMMNIYNGNVTTDAKGQAEVTLPEYFEALNRDFRYQLTVIDESDSDEFVLVRLSRTIRDGRFSIRSSAPHTRVSWQITGIRHDPYANAHRIEVESDKGPHERGKFSHADLYGHPPERNIHFLPGNAIMDPNQE